MKSKILSIAILGTITLTGYQASAHNLLEEKISFTKTDTKTVTFKVYGNCGMCEKTIEKSLANVVGVKKADWNKETKMIEVTYNEAKISLDEIKKRIADVGYDTDDFKASDHAYNELAGCCQYERPGKKEDDHSGHDH